MRIYLSKIKESWIIDRLRKDWYDSNPEISTKKLMFSDIIWIISPWIWNKIPKYYLKRKKVVCSIYHFDFDSFGEKERKNFENRDKFVDIYHVISSKTKEDLQTLTNKKIFNIPFWIDGSKWFEIENKVQLREKYNINQQSFLVGSFQRDTEGKDLISPKLIKGPDILVDNIIDLNKEKNNLLVILAGTRRQYVIKKLKEKNINFKYFEMVDEEQLNELYNLLDLYIVSSRIEGGPQAILECAATKTPIVSTDVGIASEILNKKSIYKLDSFLNAEPDVEYAYKKVKNFIKPSGIKLFKSMFEKVYEN